MRLNLVALLVVTPVTAALVYAFGIPGAAFSWVFYHLFAYVYTVPQADVLWTIGHLPDILMLQVDTALKVSLGLP